MDERDRKLLNDALVELARSYQVMDNAVLHTNNQTMMLNISEFKAIQSCTLAAIACIKDAMRIGYR